MPGFELAVLAAAVHDTHFQHLLVIKSNHNLDTCIKCAHLNFKWDYLVLFGITLLRHFPPKFFLSFFPHSNIFLILNTIIKKDPIYPITSLLHIEF